MANAKRIAKQVLYAIGKGFWFFFRALGRGIASIYRQYQEQKRIEDEQRRYYADIERENYHAGKGYARGMADVREQERVRRQNDREQREYNRRINKMFEAPKVNNNFLTEDFPANSKRKKKRSMFDF